MKQRRHGSTPCRYLHKGIIKWVSKMSLTLEQPVSRSEYPLRHKFTYDEYYRLAERGFLKDEQTELIGGEIVHMVPVGPEHVESTTSADDVMRQIFGQGYRVRVQQPLNLIDSELQPDIAVVKGEPGDFKAEHPKTAVLVMEVAQTSLEYDRTTKASLYARAGIKDYWIVNLNDRCVEAYREPVEIPSEPFGYGYRHKSVYMPGEAIAPLEKPDRSVKVNDLLV